MNLNEAESKFNRLIEELAKSQVNDALATSLDIIAFVKLRVAEGGGNSEGGQFTDYSTIYSKKRQEKGLQVGFKDFNVTGQLYASIHPNVKSVKFGEVQLDITARGVDNQMKIAGQFAREKGHIFYPTQQEITDAIDAHTKRRVAAAQKLFQ